MIEAVVSGKWGEPMTLQDASNQIYEVMMYYQGLEHQYAKAGIFEPPIDIHIEIVTLIKETVRRLRLSPTYGEQVFAERHSSYSDDEIKSVYGVLKALYSDFSSGRIATAKAMIHSEVFSDLLEMAEHLLNDGGYKDPAVVLGGSVLEKHLRELAKKNTLTTTTTDKKNGEVKNIMMDGLNTALYKADVYGPTDHKNILAWAGIRNKAAHGEDKEYNHEQVKLMLAGIREFMGRNPA